MTRWYLIRSKPSRESVAQANLERQGFTTYFPCLAENVRGDVRRGGRRVALFPRYLFLQVDVTCQSLSPVHSTVGVSNVVRLGASYTTVPEGVIHELQARADPATGLHHLESRPPIWPGSHVRIISGPLDGLNGIFQRQAGYERVLVLLTMLGRDIPAVVPAAFVDCDVAMPRL
jgi:transcriptional antiterminator RfaH